MTRFRSLSQVARVGIIAGVIILFAGAGLLFSGDRVSEEDQVATAVELLRQGAAAATPEGVVTSTLTEGSTGISVEEDLLSVDITFPASLFSNTDMSTFDPAAYAIENRFNKAVLNGDGSITVTLTKTRQREMLEEYSAQFSITLSKMIGAENTPYITGVTSNSDYTSITVDVDKAGYESAFDLTPFAIYIGSAFYQMLAGIDIHCEVTVRDNVTFETINYVVYPEALQQ